MYAGVPTTAPSIVMIGELWSCPRLSDRLLSTSDGIDGVRSSSRMSCRSSWPITFARPQSITYVSPYRPTITLSGLMSRWITPLSCANAIVSQTRRMTCTARVIVQPSS